MQLGLSGKCAVVTGASRGIGRAIAEALAAEGCDVVLAARSGDLLDHVAGEIAARTGRRALAVAIDLRSPEAAAQVVERAWQGFGRLDLLVNNAGATRRGDFFALSEDDWQDGFALKFFGYVRMSRAAWPMLKKAQGAVVNVIGVGGRTPGAEFTIGGSVNAGLLSFTKALAEYGSRDGVRVNAVSPGPIHTERLQTRIRALADAEGLDPEAATARLCQVMGVRRFGEPGEVAALVAFLAGAPAAFLHGSLIDIDGGQTRTI